MCWWAADKLGISWMILRAGTEAEYCDEPVCVYLSVNIFPVLHFKLHLILLACYLWPWLVPFIVVLRYVMYFRFLRRTSCLHIMARNRLREKGVYSQAAAQIWHCSICSDWPTQGRTRPGQNLISMTALLLLLSIGECFYYCSFQPFNCNIVGKVQSF